VEEQVLHDPTKYQAAESRDRFQLAEQERLGTVPGSEGKSSSESLVAWQAQVDQ